MWSSGRDRSRKTVVCIACGTSVLREDAREYDKEGDRWERRGKQFEHLCKECHTELTHQPREGLESLLTQIEERDLSQSEFLERYLSAIREQDGSSAGESGP